MISPKINVRSTVLSLAATAGFMALAATPAAARVDIGISLGLPGIVAPAPVVVAPPPVVYAPPSIYPAPVVVYPQPVVPVRGHWVYDRRGHRYWRRR